MRKHLVMGESRNGRVGSMEWWMSRYFKSSWQMWVARSRNWARFWVLEWTKLIKVSGRRSRGTESSQGLLTARQLLEPHEKTAKEYDAQISQKQLTTKNNHELRLIKKQPIPRGCARGPGTRPRRAHRRKWNGETTGFLLLSFSHRELQLPQKFD